MIRRMYAVLGEHTRALSSWSMPRASMKPMTPSMSIVSASASPAKPPVSSFDAVDALDQTTKYRETGSLCSEGERHTFEPVE